MAADESHDEKTQSFVALTKGTKVSHYRIVDKIGAGGMGEVYLAEDTQLDRKVALKFLAPHLSQDEAARARFTREAKATAKLDHPNIVPVYEVSEFQGRPFFAMQVVEGRSLKEAISGEDLPMDRILEIGIQVAEGLQAAHIKGIVHRDIKPSNILLDSQGRVRIVDFGLAAMQGTESLTKTGSTLGTIGYMSPEQVQGREIDQRSDLFSLGVVLYELITKQNPFRRDSEAATLKAVSDDTVHPLARYRSGLPDGLQAIVDKALEKDFKTRYQHADEMESDLLRLQSGISEPYFRPSRSRSPVSRKKLYAWLSPAIAAVVILAIAYWQLELGSDKSTAPTYAKKQITHYGDVLDSDVSPDGSLVAYVRRSESGRCKLYVQDLTGSAPLEIYDERSIGPIRWSRDGSEILLEGRFGSGDRDVELVVVPRLGGTHRPYATGQPAAQIAWSPDGLRFLWQYHTKTAWIVDKATGSIEEIRIDVPSEFIWGIDWSPKRDWLAVQGGGPPYEPTQLWIAGLDGSLVSKVIDSCFGKVRWSADGDALYFLRGGSGGGKDLVRLEVDANTGSAKGEPVVLAEEIRESRGTSVTADGRMALYCQTWSWSNLWLAEMDSSASGAESLVRQITKGTSQIYLPTVSPDGETVAFFSLREGFCHLFTVPLEGGDMVQLTHGSADYTCPAWSPDGNTLACKYSDGIETSIALVSVIGGQATTLASTDSVSEDVAWYPGERIAYQKIGNRNIELVDPTTGRTDLLISHDTVGWAFWPAYSSDGGHLAFYWNRTIDSTGTVRDFELLGMYIVALGDSIQEPNRIVEGWVYPLYWSPDEEWIYYLDNRRKDLLFRVNLLDHSLDTVLISPLEGISWYALADSSKIVMEVWESQSDLWLVEAVESRKN